jgi:hypothetical protein
MFYIVSRSLVAFVVLAGTGLIAPAAEFTKLLPDDTSMVFTANVKQIIGSAAFAKHYRKMADDFLKTEPAQMILKDSGFDPFKDVDRVVFAMGRNMYEATEDPNSNNVSFDGIPLGIIQGRFDPAKLHAKLGQLVQQHPGMLVVHKVGDVKLYEMTQPQKAFAALIDAATIVVGSRTQVTAALEKAAGKKTAKLQNKLIAQTVEKLDAKLSILATIVEEAVISTSVSRSGNQKPDIKYFTLGDSGMAGLRITATIGEDIKGKAEITGKDADQTKKLAQDIEDGLKKAIAEGAKEVATEKELAPVVDALKTVKTAVKDQVITLEGQAAGDAVIALIKAWFTVRTVETKPAQRRGN